MLRLHFLVRLLALTGLLVAGVGALISATELDSWTHNSIRAAMHGERGQTATYAVCLMLGGVLLAVVIFALDFLVGLRKTAGRRSAVGLNVILQVALATALLVGINVWSFSPNPRHRHYLRFDCTRDHRFTLEPKLKEQLEQLRGETTVVVYQHPEHKMFGRFADKSDRYDKAAERKVVEKVKDLVELLRDVGPQFRVVVLDVEDEDYEEKLAEQAEKFPRLKDVVNSARENSIFFCAGDQIQRMDFNEFYQLDKSGSRQEVNGRRNLVLLSQGIEPFARRVLAIEEKRPRVAVAVAHPWLSTEGPLDEYTLAGLRKTLTNYGFDVRDIILKKFVGRRGRGLRMENSALSADESKFDQLEAQVQPLRLMIARDRQQIGMWSDLLSLLASNKTLDEVNAELRKRGVISQNEAMEEAARKLNIERIGPQLEDAKRELVDKEKKLKEREVDLERLQAQERVVEGQRVTDLKKKLSTLLAECDMLIVARMTLRDVGIGDVIPLSLHQIDENQLAAIKEFMKAGKPVLFCCGPNNDQPDPSDPPDRKPTPPSDNLENMLAEVGLVFAPQTVLYDSEADDIASSQAISFGRATAANIPPVEFPEKFVLSGIVQTSQGPPLPSNPIASSMRLMKRSAGQPLELRLRHPRPVYFRSLNGPPAFERAFLSTSAASWNEDQPFPTDDRPVPRFDPPKGDDPSKGTLWEKRRGPFPIGVAIETTLPVEWYDPQYGAVKAAELAASGVNNPAGLPFGFATQSLISTETFVPAAAKGQANFIAPKKVRLAVVGHGGWFAGAKLPPADETLLLNTTNWLLDRDDRLPRAEPEWRFPRVDLSSSEQLLWRWGTFLCLPGLFAYLGLVVLLVRRMR